MITAKTNDGRTIEVLGSVPHGRKFGVFAETRNGAFSLVSLHNTMAAAARAMVRVDLVPSNAPYAQLTHDAHVEAHACAITQTGPACDSCGRAITLYEFHAWSVCMPCTKKRHRSVLSGGRCVCGGWRGRMKRGYTFYTVGSREVFKCNVCLGSFTPKTEGR